MSDQVNDVMSTVWRSVGVGGGVGGKVGSRVLLSDVCDVGGDIGGEGLSRADVGNVGNEGFDGNSYSVTLSMDSTHNPMGIPSADFLALDHVLDSIFELSPGHNVCLCLEDEGIE